MSVLVLCFQLLVLASDSPSFCLLLLTLQPPPIPPHNPAPPSASWRYGVMDPCWNGSCWWVCTVSSLIIHSWLFELGPVVHLPLHANMGLLFRKLNDVCERICMYTCVRDPGLDFWLCQGYILWSEQVCFSVPVSHSPKPLWANKYWKFLQGQQILGWWKGDSFWLSGLIPSHQCTPPCWAAHSQPAAWPALLFPLLFALHLHKY